MLFVLFAAQVQANRNVQLVWTANSDSPAVDGYKLYYKTGDPVAGADLNAVKQNYNGTDANGANASPIQISNQSTAQYILLNLYSGQKYAFVLTAYRGSDESDPTNAIVLDAISTSIAPSLIRLDEIK